MPRPDRSPRLGYALAAAAATLWAVNGSLARFLLDDGVSPAHLAELRSGLSFVLLAGFLAVVRRRDLRVRRAEIPQLAWLGIALATVHALYFLAIAKLDIGVALVIQYLGPLLVLVWLRFAHGRRLARSLWGAVMLSVVGAFFVVEAYAPEQLHLLGLVAACGSAITFAVYLVASERAGHRHAPQTTLAWGFGFAALFWLVARPPHTFPFEKFDSPEPLLLGLGVVVVGTLAPFVLIVAAVRHIPASRAGVVATLEPVLAALVAWPVHDQALGLPQVLGGLVVVAAVVWVQSHRPDVEQESSPVPDSARRVL